MTLNNNQSIFDDLRILMICIARTNIVVFIIEVL